MKTIALASLTALMFVAPLATADASSATPGVDSRERHQMQRIYNGVRSGALSPHETGRLLAGQAYVRALERRAKADGVVTWRERARLHHALNVQSRRIWREKHD